MSTDFSFNSELSREKLYGMTKQPKKAAFAEGQPEQVQAKSVPNPVGFQWVQTQASQANLSQKPGQMGVQNKNTSYEITAPNLDDVAMISSTVSTKEESIAYTIGQKIITHLGINVGALREKFKEYYKKSKSHNLLLERFMANVKMSGLAALINLSGLSGEEIENMKAQVRNEALNEIESKLRQDWAYAKAMIEIVG